MKKFWFINWTIILAVVMGCSKTGDNILEKSSNNSVSSTKQKYKLFVADSLESIPDFVDDKVLDLAQEKKYEHIRVLKIDSEKSNKYHVTFFTPNLEPLEAKELVAYPSSKKVLSINKIDIRDPSCQGEFYLGNSLKKTTIDCWPLAEFYEHAGHSGDGFNFKYSYGIGHWHTIIYNLGSSWSGCGGSSYPANYLQDKISSHYWVGEAYAYWPLFQYPRHITVWQKAYRQGRSKKWGAKWIRGTGMVINDGNYSNHGVNDMVSSIQMTFDVYSR